MTDTELLTALRCQSELAGQRYRKQLELVAKAPANLLHLDLTALVLMAQDCQHLEALIHQQEFHAKQKAEMAATAS